MGMEGNSSGIALATACAAGVALAVFVLAALCRHGRRSRSHGRGSPEARRSADTRVLLQEVGRRSKAVMYVVSNKTNDEFSVRGLSSYLRKQGVEVVDGLEDPERATVANAQRLIELLDSAGPPAPVKSLRHELVPGVVCPAHLETLFPAMKDAYVPQELDYGRNSRYGDRWRISCYLVVMENWKPKILPHEPMVQCMAPVMNACTEKFRKWHCGRRGVSSVEVSVMNAFVTRYRAVQEEDQLKKHIDGANVDGSVILALPTDDPFEGGALHVWDGKPKQQEFVYSMRAGDAIFLDNAVWHQAKPITSGTRWALVLFLRVR